MDTPIAYTIAKACAVARAGRTALYEAIRNGALQARKRGRRTLILADDLRRWVESLPALEPKGQNKAPADLVKYVSDKTRVSTAKQKPAA